MSAVLRIRDLIHRPGVPSLVEDLHDGVVRWDLVHPFPAPEPGDRAAGDGVVAELAALLGVRVDPVTVDEQKMLPDGLVEELRARGFFRLAVSPHLGGRGLSYLNVFRVIAAAASWSVPVGLIMAVEAGIGASAFLPALPPGQLRELLEARLARGLVSGGADTEPVGAANRRRTTVAVPVDDGAAYLLTGEKVHIGNAPIAELLVVTATVREGDADHVRLFFVDTATPGFALKSRHEFMGIKGFPNAALTFDRVRVPRERMFVEQPFDSRITPAGITISARGRMFLIAAPSLAISRRCVEAAREFARRRSVDGRGLGEYEEIQRGLAESLADVFAIETIVEWGLLADRPGAEVNPIMEQLEGKNLCSRACWRVVERTMSLLASEGFEVASSKGRRGVPPHPMERLFRDARGLRISGGVDFQLDNWAGRYILAAYYDRAPDELARLAGGAPAESVGDEDGLSPRGRVHLAFTRAQAAALRRTCVDLVRRFPDPEVLFARERVLILLAQIVAELTAMTLVLGRAARLACEGRPSTEKLADVYCAAARQRLEAIAPALSAASGVPDTDGAFAETSRAWLESDNLDFLIDDLIAAPGAAR